MKSRTSEAKRALGPRLGLVVLFFEGKNLKKNPRNIRKIVLKPNRKPNPRAPTIFWVVLVGFRGRNIPS